MSELSIALQPRRGRKRRYVLIGFVLGLPLTLFLIAFTVARTSGARSLSAAQAEADRLDPTWRLVDLEASRAPYPESGKNGLDQIILVDQALSEATMWPQWPFPQFEADTGYLAQVRSDMEQSLSGDRMKARLLNTEQERVLRAELKRVDRAIGLARRMPEFPYGRYPIKWTKDYIGTLIPHVQKARMIAQLMTYDALLRAHDNDVAGALHNAKARIAVDSVAKQIVERSLTCGQASEKELADLQHELELESQTPYFLIGARGDRATMDGLFENIQNGDITFMECFRYFVTGLSGDSMNPLEFLKSYASIRNERATQLRHKTAVVEAAKLPPEHVLSAIEKADQDYLPVKNSLVKLLSSANSKVAAADLRAKAILRTAFAALACERFRLARCRWPARLDELVPVYLTEVPLDPFDGKPLRLLRTGTVLIVYSVSVDGVDNGGTLLPNPTTPGSDVGFILHDVDKRRQPAPPFQLPPRNAEPEAAPAPDKDPG
jgi:hypothetical protein